MKKRLLVIAYIALFATFSYFCNENELNPQWWQNATITDVAERFRAYKHLRYKDSEKRNFLHLACIYSKDAAIAEYFIWRGVYLFAQDKNGNTAYDYAAKNPYLKEFAEKMKKLENVDYIERLQSLQEKGVEPNIDLLFPIRRETIKPIIADISDKDAVVFNYYKFRRKK